MKVHNVELIRQLVEQGEFSAKMVFNAKGALFFPVTNEHRDMKVEGISYEDDYKGDAMAAMLAPGKIEIRFHEQYSDTRVGDIVSSLLSDPSLLFMKEWRVTYQGRDVAR